MPHDVVDRIPPRWTILLLTVDKAVNRHKRVLRLMYAACSLTNELKTSLLGTAMDHAGYEEDLVPGVFGGMPHVF